jgi:hypothetical protein
MAGANEPHAIVKAVMAIALRMAAWVGAAAAEEEQDQVMQQQNGSKGMLADG